MWTFLGPPPPPCASPARSWARIVALSPRARDPDKRAFATLVRGLTVASAGSAGNAVRHCVMLRASLGWAGVETVESGSEH
jgi:hypothetical protein